jgi:TAP-like protein
VALSEPLFATSMMGWPPPRIRALRRIGLGANGDPTPPIKRRLCPTRTRSRGSSCRKRTSIWSGIDGVGEPTLVIAGEQDAVTPLAPAARLAERLPNAELRSLDTGHAGHWERPEEGLAGRGVRRPSSGRRNARPPVEIAPRRSSRPASSDIAPRRRRRCARGRSWKLRCNRPDCALLQRAWPVVARGRPAGPRRSAIGREACRPVARAE